ncbi:bifunctional adenosylcobinamide kinase/adenosylcobinamide-phosphate guanylyltransferase [Rhodococcus sp. ABRD24]|uniref:bifunctional adenosylcobinamide kinase/adenosylcobinamide-phosphate guanylyltransferase n=1 Tax=Rhodococcus sp. ABRD24 TaxID=2507582 RepID=UPI00103A7079|nr:bifunctional adenosylcobinamide kinase/adenosylcobinamide-phosphate guanylyltransferase [Rhodococcus sp. ABRD24]QBJ95867.1 bifunctional adenosylcobinamide kinase/adenosylcobinamide-phosphate guanylyltransferase [Rhodococcus sp. ABRD24]
MEVVLLGTGSADGWPNPFCTCASCRTAAVRGEIRGQTAALVDDTILLDCGPEVPRAAVHAGRSLARVRHILFTHAHPDHVGPAALLFRAWVRRDEPLDVIGPAEALDLCRDWVGPDDPVNFVPVGAGDRIALGGYTIRVLEAAHTAVRDGDSVLYDITSPGGDRMLWATDTGPLPASTLDAVRNAAYGALFLEETFGTRTDLGAGHHDLTTFPRTLAALRESGAITAATDVVAVHLSHYNPPTTELAARLAPWGARVVADGATVTVGARTTTASPGIRRTLVLGGARAGKSTYAEALLAAHPRVTYLATGGVREGDREWAERIALHRARRPDGWTTVETTDAAAVLRGAQEPVLLDCLGTWLTGRLDHHGVWNGGDWSAVGADIADLLGAVRAVSVPVVAVSNEVGSGVVPPTPAGRRFRDLLGRVNSAVAAESESVVLVVAGVPTLLQMR